MAHECPECGELCFCGFDIDDCMNNLPEDQVNCTHYLVCESEEEQRGPMEPEGIMGIEDKIEALLKNKFGSAKYNAH